MDEKALFKLSSGLFLLIAKTGKDNGCIINTVMQVTASPIRIVIAVNKNNYTHDMIKETGSFNVSVLTESAPMDLYRRFGYVSGRDNDKFKELSCISRSDNGLLYLTEYSNAFLSGKVIEERDLGTHTLFYAEITDGEKLTDDNSVTYDFYQKNIKPVPEIKVSNESGFIHAKAKQGCANLSASSERDREAESPVHLNKPAEGYMICTVCGYIYEGDTLPKDYICPVCKHGAEAFKPI